MAALPGVPFPIHGGDFSRQILFPIVLVVLCSLLLHRDPWATGSDLREGGVSLGMFPLGCKSWAAQLHLLSATHWQNFPFGSFPSPCWSGPDSHQHRYLFCRTHMPVAGIGNSLVLPLESGWRRRKAIPALHLPP